MKYRKKSVMVEAVQWLGTAESFYEITTAFPDMRWAPGPMGEYSFFVETLEGEHIASKGDYIIRDVKGEFYLCPPNIFEMAYDKE